MPTVSDWDDILSCWMADANCSSWAQLQRDATLSRYRIRQLRQCQLTSWPLQAIQNLCTALDISLVELLAAANLIDQIHPEPTDADTHTKPTRLDKKSRSQSNTANVAPPSPPFDPPLSDTYPSDTYSSAPQSPEAHQQATLQILEPLLRQLPTAAYAVQHHNLPASQLLKLLKPLETLLAEWNVVQLGAVGQVVPFDPAWQSSLTDVEHERDTPVSIRYVGYRVGIRTWLKAQVRAEM